MTEIREVYQAVVIAGWIEATDAAISALVEWRCRLGEWGNGGLVPREELQAALHLLDCAGMGEWCEWGAAAGSLDALAKGLQCPVDEVGDASRKSRIMSGVMQGSGCPASVD